MLKLPKLPTLQPRERLLAIGSGLVFLIVLLDRLVLSPWLGHARSVRREIRAMEEALLSHQRLLSRQARVEAALERYQPYLRPPIADDLQTAALLKELEQIAIASHVAVGEVKPLPIEKDAVAKRYPLEVRFNCTPEEWIEFVFRIETSPSLFEIQRAGLAVTEDSPNQLEGFLRVVGAAVLPAQPQTDDTDASS